MIKLSSLSFVCNIIISVFKHHRWHNCTQCRCYVNRMIPPRTIQHRRRNSFCFQQKLAIRVKLNALNSNLNMRTLKNNYFWGGNCQNLSSVTCGRLQRAYFSTNQCTISQYPEQLLGDIGRHIKEQNFTWHFKTMFARCGIFSNSTQKLPMVLEKHEIINIFLIKVQSTYTEIAQLVQQREFKFCTDTIMRLS